MKLYVTERSPYARLVRLVVHEKHLEDRVEVVVARTRTTDSPFYDVNPSGRVPYLVRDDGVGMEDSRLVCAYLDTLGGRRLAPDPSAHGWEVGRIEAIVRSWLDGMAVWAREVRRAENEQSPGIVAHEEARAERLADHLEHEVKSPVLSTNEPTLVAFTLILAIEYAARYLEWDPRVGRPQLAAWAAVMAQHPSVVHTR